MTFQNRDEQFELFESALKMDVDDEHLDYSVVWNRLELKIDDAEKLGDLALLKIHEFLPDEACERVEKGLKKRAKSRPKKSKSISGHPESQPMHVEEEMSEILGIEEEFAAYERSKGKY